MKNPVSIIGKMVSNHIEKMDLADIGKTAAGLMMIAGGLIVLKYGSAPNLEDVPEVVIDEAADAAVSDAVEATNVVIETVEEVAAN